MAKKNRVKQINVAFVDFLNGEDLEKPNARPWYTGSFMLVSPSVVSLPGPTPRVFLKIHRELRRDVRDLLVGKRIEEIETKINIPQPKTFVRLIEKGVKRQFPGFHLDVHPNPVNLDGKVYFVAKLTSMETDFRKLAYGILRNLVESGQLRRLGICGRKECSKFKFHKTKPPKYCSEECRWAVNNARLDRKMKRRKGGDWY